MVREKNSVDWTLAKVFVQIFTILVVVVMLVTCAVKNNRTSNGEKEWLDRNALSDTANYYIQELFKNPESVKIQSKKIYVNQDTRHVQFSGKASGTNSFNVRLTYKYVVNFNYNYDSNRMTYTDGFLY